MKTTYFRQRPTQPPVNPSEKTMQDFGLQYLRARVLNNVYYLASLTGSLALLANSPSLIQNRQWGTLTLYAVILLGVFILALFQKIPYLIKALYFLAVFFLVGLSDFLSDGLYGSGRFFFLILPILTGLLIGLRGRIVAIFITVTTSITIAALMLTGGIPAPEPNASTSNASLIAWIIAIASFILLVSMTSVIMGFMIQGLENSLQNQSLLTNELESERTLLEQRVLSRTAEVERRLVQLRTAAEISRTISTILELNQLLPQVCELVRQRFDLYYVGIFLIEETYAAQEKLWEPDTGPSKYAVLAAGSGEEGRRMLAEGHRLRVGGESMIGWCTANKRARIALDVGQEAVRFNNPVLPNTRSELALPIQSQNIVLGALTIQSTQPSAFDQDDITSLQGIADGLASAIENARLFSEVQSGFKEIQQLHHQYLERSWFKLLSEKTNLEFTYEDKETPTVEEQRQIQMPILLRDQSIGQIVLETNAKAGETATQWKPEEIALIEAVTTQAALALENARLLDETQKRAMQEEQLNLIMAKSERSLDLDAVMKTVVQEISKSIKSTRVAIQLDDELDNSQVYANTPVG